MESTCKQSGNSYNLLNVWMSIMQTYGRSDFVSRKLSTKEQLRIEREKSMQLLNKHTMLRSWQLLETTTLLADEQDEKHTK